MSYQNLSFSLEIRRYRRHAAWLCGWLLFGAALADAADWNSQQIDWQEYDAGMVQAQTTGKPVMLVFHSEGCGACNQYSELFVKPEVVTASADLVMILVDDGNEELSSRYAFDGSYVPRTFFLTPEGEHLDIQLGKSDPTFRYYYGSRKSQGLVSAMQESVATVTATAVAGDKPTDKE